MVNARLYEKTRPAFFFASQRHLRARDVLTLFINENKQIGTQKPIEILALQKNPDAQTATLKNRECETQITPYKTRVRDTWNSTTMLRDPWVLRDNSSPHMYPDCKQISTFDLPVRNFVEKVFLHVVYSCLLDFPCNRLVYHR